MTYIVMSHTGCEEIAEYQIYSGCYLGDISEPEICSIKLKNPKAFIYKSVNPIEQQASLECIFVLFSSFQDKNAYMYGVMIGYFMRYEIGESTWFDIMKKHRLRYRKNKNKEKVIADLINDIFQ